MMISKIVGALCQYLKDFYLKIQIKNGLTIGKNVFLGNKIFFDPNFPWLISIGDDCTITSGVIILAHDASTKKHLGYTKIGKVIIGKKTYIGVGSIILPGVIIGDNVIIAAGSVVTKNVPSDVVIGGNPAKIISSTAEYIEKHKRNMATRPIFQEGWTLETGLSNENKELMKRDLEDGIAYII